MASWILKNKKVDIDKMCRSLNVNKIIATIMANRNLLDRENALRYINPQLDRLRDVTQLDDVVKAFDILISAKRDNKKIFVYGDYDVDGVTSTVILYKMLCEFGAAVEYFIPNRVDDGYGLNTVAIKKIYDLGCDILFTCDNGIAALEEVEYAKSLGMTVIILDHHEPLYEIVAGEPVDTLPKADAIIDAKIKDSKYPFKELCAGGLSFKFAKAFLEYTKVETSIIDELLVFGGLATICDIVDLQDENRIIAKNSIEIINRNKSINIGLEKLIIDCGLSQKEITEYSYGFMMGPCINASGRLESASMAVELFVTADEARAIELSGEIVRLNIERKEMTEQCVKRACECIEKSDIKNDRVFVVYIPQMHESIAGIVAGKIKELYYRPTIVITDSGNIAKGSARSINGYDVFEALRSNSDILIKAGGHTLAAGLSLEKNNIDLLRKRLNDKCALEEKDLVPKIYIDMELSFDELCLSVIDDINGLMPFGKGNEPPLFATKNVCIKSINIVGANKNIAQVYLADENNIFARGIIFSELENFINKLEQKNGADSIDYTTSGFVKNLNIKMDIVYSLSVNEYNGNRSVQLIIKDFR